MVRPQGHIRGERNEEEEVRSGSINTTVDFLPGVDNVFFKTFKRYPTNEELQLVLSLQASMLIQKVAFGTELLSVEPNPDKTIQGNKIAILRITERGGRQRIIKIRTDAAFISSGLGEPTYGFDLKGSKAERVIRETEGVSSFPKISTTLEAFKAFADRTEQDKAPKETVVIWGGGNSADTLIELIGGLFQSESPLVQNITKIYVVTEQNLSARPRYAQIRDLLERGGRSNLVEIVKSRVSDTDFGSDEDNPIDRKIVVLDKDGNVIKNKRGQPIMADAGIAATGFKPATDRIFASYLKGQSFRDDGSDAPLQPLTLPTNPDVAVADVLRDDPDVLFLGTASKPRFAESKAKLGQLPKSARDALLRNGAENAVAIGFRAPDTQAAVNIWLNKRDINLTPVEKTPLPRIPIQGPNPLDRALEIERTVSTDNLQIPDNLPKEGKELMLSPLLAYNLRNMFELSEPFTGKLSFQLTFDAERERFVIQPTSSDLQGLSSEFLSGLIMATSDEYFQRYALGLLKSIRGDDPALKFGISFSGGKINARKTYVRAI